jgi:hypothetical protein
MKNDLPGPPALRRTVIAIACAATAVLLAWQPAAAYAASKEKPAAAAAPHTLSLSSRDQVQIWRHLRQLATRTSIPAGLHVGEVVPDTMDSRAFARDVRRKVPVLRSYSYALTHNQVLIVDRRSKKIVAVVGP